MPLRPDLTVEDVVRIVIETSQAPRHARKDDRLERTEKDDAWEIAASNTGVFVLQALGYTFAEIKQLMADYEGSDTCRDAQT